MNSGERVRERVPLRQAVAVVQFHLRVHRIFLARSESALAK